MKDGTHYSAEKFNLLLDGRLTSDEAGKMNVHIGACTECRRTLEALGRINAAIRHLPLVETRPDFTRSTIDRILIAPKPSLLFRLLEKASYVFGMFIVLGLMVAAFVLTGVFSGSDIEQTRSVVTGMAASAGDGLSTTLNAFNGWLVRYLPFAFGKGSMSIAFFALMVLVMIAAVDRLVGRRVMSK